MLHYQTGKNTHTQQEATYILGGGGVQYLDKIIIIIIDNFCIAIFFGVLKLTALYNILHYFLSFYKHNTYNYDS